MSRPRVATQKRDADTAASVFQRLVEAILSGQFESGTPLREAALARRWNVSRTPLREAVRRAAEGGLLILRPNRAPLVRPLGIPDVRALYDLRQILEVHALDLAWPSLIGRPAQDMLALARRAAPEGSRWQPRCQRFDLKLHRWWTDRSGNAWLKADLDRHYQFLRIFQRWVGRDAEALAKSYGEHLLIVEAICDGDRKRARRALIRHIRQSVRLVEAAIRDCSAK
jgi:DNA-binding GntR family transcriptional regulator